MLSYKILKLLLQIKAVLPKHIQSSSKLLLENKKKNNSQFFHSPVSYLARVFDTY